MNQYKPKHREPLRVASDEGFCPNFGSMERLKAAFDRGYRMFLAKRGMAEEEEWRTMSLDGRRRRPHGLTIGRLDRKRAFIRKRQLELGEDPDQFRDELD